MPTTRPRRLRFGGAELTITLDRMLAERIKSTALYRRVRHSPPPMAFADNAPVPTGVAVDDVSWYHTIELPDGTVTPGFVDHRSQVEAYGLPASLTGKRCLDVATFDGFWAFELERRGALEVVGIDVHSRADCDFPRNFSTEFLGAQPNEIKGVGFAWAKQALASRVQRRVLSVYELEPAVVGTFDFVVLSDLLMHLRDPLRALEAVRTVVAPGGELILAEVYDAALDQSGEEGATRFMVGLDDWAGCQWWRPSTSALEALLRVARFDDVEVVSRFDLQSASGSQPKVVLRARAGE